MGTVTVLGVGIAWELLAVASSFRFLPPITEIFASFPGLASAGVFETFLLPSIRRTLLGFALGSSIGSAVGISVGYFRRADPWLRPIIDFLRSVPVAAVVPLAFLLFGPSDLMTLSLIAFGSLWPVLINAIDGARRVDSLLIDTAKISGVTRGSLLLRVILPGTLPQLVAGLRVGLGIALIMMVLSEMVASVDGIGYFILVTQRTFRIPEMYAGVILIGVLGWLFNLVFYTFEQRILSWHHLRRGT